MPKSTYKERPGIVIYFDSMTTLSKLSDEAAGKYIKACLEYGKNLAEPNFDCVNVFDQIRLETLWEQTKPRIDSDAEGWKDGIIQRKYAGYCSSCNRNGEEPMMYEDYKVWCSTLEERKNSELL